MDEFISQHGSKRSQRSQRDIMRQWSLAVRDMRRGRLLIALWTSTAGRRWLLSAWRKWTLVVHESIIVRCVQALWRGFRVRHLDPTCARRYRYLTRFKRRVPTYLSCLRRTRGQRVFRALKSLVRMAHSVRLGKENEAASVRCLSVLLRRVTLARRERVAVRRLRRWRLRRALLGRLLRGGRIRRRLLTGLVRKSRVILGEFLLRLKRRVRLRMACCLGRDHFRRRQMEAALCRWMDWTLRATFARRWRMKMRDMRMRGLLVGWRRAAGERRERRRRVRALCMLRALRIWRVLCADGQDRRIVLRAAARSLRLKGVLFRYWLSLARYRAGRASAGRVGRERRPRTLTLPGALTRGTGAGFGAGSRSGGEGQGLLFLLLRRGFRRFRMRARLRASTRRRLQLHQDRQQRSDRARLLKMAFDKLQRQSHRRSRTGSWSYPHRGTQVRSSTLRKNLFRRGQGQGRGLEDLSDSSSQLQEPYQYHPHGPVGRAGGWGGGWGKGAKGGRARRVRSPAALLALRQQMLRNIHMSHSQALTRSRSLSHPLSWTDGDGRLEVLPLLAQWKMRARTTAKWKRKAAKVFAGFMQRFLHKRIRGWIAYLVHMRQIRSKTSFTVKRARLKRLRSIFRTFLGRLRGRRRARRAARAEQLQQRRALCLQVLRDLRKRVGYARLLHRSLLCVRRLRNYLRFAVRQIRKAAVSRVKARALDRRREWTVMAMRMRRFLGRLRKNTRYKEGRGIMKRLLRTHCEQMRARKMLRWWRTFSRVRSRLHKIVRRLYLRSFLTTWHAAYAVSDRNSHVIKRVSKRINLRLKGETFLMWKLFAVRSARISLQARLVRQRLCERSKMRALFAWMKVMDSNINRAKFLSVCSLHNTRCAARALEHWVRLTLSVCRSRKRGKLSAFRNWQVSVGNSRHVRTADRRAARMDRGRRLGLGLFAFRRTVLRIRNMKRIMRRAGQVRLLRVFMVFFRRWKRRMHIRTIGRDRRTGSGSGSLGLRSMGLGQGRKEKALVVEFELRRRFSCWRR